MTELNGTLEGIGLQQLLRFLQGLHSGGNLVVEDGPWIGTLMLTEGQLVGARFGAEQGVAALDAIVLALPRGRFTFSSAIESCEVNIVLKPDDLSEHLEAVGGESARLVAAVPSLGAVPYLLEPGTPAAEGDQITLSQRALRLLLALDGRRNVALLARERGVLHTLRELAELTNLGLIGMDSPSNEPPAEKATRPADAAAELQPSATAARDEAAAETTAATHDHSLRASMDARAAEQRRRLAEPESTPAEHGHNGASNGRRFWSQR